MRTLKYDVVVIGGGPAGLAAALKAREKAEKVAVLERNDELGGILNQCIHLSLIHISEPTRPY